MRYDLTLETGDAALFPGRARHSCDSNAALVVHTRCYARRIVHDVGLHLPKHSPATAAIAGAARRVASSIHLHMQEIVKHLLYGIVLRLKQRNTTSWH